MSVNKLIIKLQALPIPNTGVAYILILVLPIPILVLPIPNTGVAYSNTGVAAS